MISGHLTGHKTEVFWAGFSPCPKTSNLCGSHLRSTTALPCSSATTTPSRLLHTSSPARTSVGTVAVMIRPQQDVRRRVVLPPAITSPNHKYNKNNQHRRQQLGQVMADVMHNASVGRRQRTGLSVMLNRQFGDVAHRTTIVTTV